jgi:chromosome segregation ATPase
VTYGCLSNFDREILFDREIHDRTVKKVEEMKRQSEEISKAIQMGIVELDALRTKLTEKTEKQRRLMDKLVQLWEKIRQLESTSTVDHIEELATLKAELLANNEKRAELEAARDGKRKELEELTKAEDSLFKKIHQYLFPNS